MGNAMRHLPLAVHAWRGAFRRHAGIGGVRAGLASVTRPRGNEGDGCKAIVQRSEEVIPRCLNRLTRQACHPPRSWKIRLQ